MGVTARLLDRSPFSPPGLNADVERFPPREFPDPRRRTGRWGRSSVWEILRNPKYTGYQVRNRRARKRGGKTNPPEQWIWSEEPPHEAPVSRETFEEAVRGSVSRDNVVKAARARADYAPRTYLLRSFLRCDVSLSADIVPRGPTLAWVKAAWSDSG